MSFKSVKFIYYFIVTKNMENIVRKKVGLLQIVLMSIIQKIGTVPLLMFSF